MESMKDLRGNVAPNLSVGSRLAILIATVAVAASFGLAGALIYNSVAWHSPPKPIVADSELPSIPPLPAALNH
jgi:hypothetical protein